MSLKVWLPLNGTLENKGTTDITASNYGATVDNNGKIGKCYKFNPDNSSSGQNYIKLNAKSSDIFQSGQSFSLSCFFKLTGDLYSNGCGLIACSQYKITGFGLMINQRKICVQLCFGDNELEWKPTMSSFDNDVWYHVCFTYNEIGKKLALYVDGNLIATTTETRDWQVNTSYEISIGLGTQGGWGYTIPGFMNDVRIYDHALSSVEVKEISRALTRHYKLDSTDITDSSGYNNHGTVYGTATLNADTPRYSNCIYMNNRSSTNHIEANSINSSDNKFSVSFWVKAAKSTAQVLFADPKITVGLLSGGITACSYSLYINGTSASLASSSNYYVHNADKLWLLNRSYNTSYAGNGYMSDFRVYNTILSEDDVRQLYNVSGKIDNKNNVHGFELIENNKKSIEKTGNINFDFEERDTNVFIYKQVNPNLLQGTVINSLRFERTSGMGTEFGKRFTPISQLQVNTYYTFSAMIRGNANMNVYTINTGGNQAFTYVNKEDLDEKEFKLFSLTFRVTGNRVIQEIYPCSRYGEANTLVGDWYEIQENSIKLEEGEMCTPWVPAQTDNYYRSYDNMFTAKQFIEI